MIFWSVDKSSPSDPIARNDLGFSLFSVEENRHGVKTQFHIVSFFLVQDSVSRVFGENFFSSAENL